jgi:cobalamin biosynthesis protein CobW
MMQPIPVTIVSGFLGSGKTTLLCDLLKRRQERRLAVLINELGDVSIDGALARASAGDSDEIQIVDFPLGLIAYAQDSRFVPTLQAIAARHGHIDHVLIETSGVALPSAAMARLQSPELAGDFILDATLVVVDTPRLLAGEFDRGNTEAAERAATASPLGALFEQQLEQADVVVLNKIDELQETALLEAEQCIRRRAPCVRFVELAQHAQLDVRLALGLRLHQATAPVYLYHQGAHASVPGENTQPLIDHGRIDGHKHSGLTAHSHGLTTHTHFHEHDPGWLSFTLRSGQPQDVGRLRTALERAAESEPILRCKGFARSGESERPVLLQGVRTRVVLSSAAPKSPVTVSELVFIGYHLSRARVASVLNTLTGTAWS